jgi:phospholipase/lecithinase/hemolysin
LTWDNIGHPTRTAHRLIGDTAFATVAPEPASVSLVLAGGVLTLAWWRKRSGKGRQG